MLDYRLDVKSCPATYAVMILDLVRNSAQHSDYLTAYGIYT